MLSALTDLNSYKTAHSLSSADLLTIGDINHDGKLDNRDLQKLLGLVASQGRRKWRRQQRDNVDLNAHCPGRHGTGLTDIAIEGSGPQKPALRLSSGALIATTGNLVMQSAATTFSKHSTMATRKLPDRCQTG